MNADGLLLLTDVANVQRDYGTPRAHAIGQTTVGALREMDFAAGSMGPKVEAACRFVERTGGTAAIGTLADAARLLAAETGTVVHANDPASGASAAPANRPRRLRNDGVRSHIARRPPAGGRGR